MATRLFDTHNHVIAAAVTVLRLSDGQVYGFGLIVTVPDHLSFIIDHIPAILGLVVVDVKDALRTTLLRARGLSGH